MGVLALIFALLLANRVKPTTQINITAFHSTDVNTLPAGSTEAVFATQIRQIRPTSEAAPAASAGSNLNVVGDDDSLQQPENFQAISTIYSSRNKTTSDAKYDNEQRQKLSSTRAEKENAGEKASEKLSEENFKALPLIWDGCVETKVRQDKPNELKSQNDMEHSKDDFQININREIGNQWNKRHANNSDARNAWLEKYKQLLNTKMDERRQQKQDIIIRKVTFSTTPSSETATTEKLLPITREIFKISTQYINLTEDLVTENNIRTSFTEDWFETKDRTKIRFSSIPHTENYLIPTLRLEEGFHPFAFMSEFFSLIYPFEFPLGLIKDIVWGKFTFPYSFLQSIKIESTFLGFIIFFACLALVIPAYLIILGVLALMSKSRCDDEMETGTLFPESEGSDFNDRLLAIFTLFVLLICCMFIAGMVLSNEQAHAAASVSRNAMSCACADIAAWLATAARELHHSVVPPLDLVLQAFRDDSKNVEQLLGEPIQQAISSESGIDLVLDSLADIVAESEDLSLKISSLRDISMRAGGLAASTSDRIKDLGRQLDSLKAHCTAKDGPLCDTINTHSLEMQMQFDLILHEHQLLDLRSLGVENLTLAISTTRQEFKTLPSAISSQTIQVRADIVKDVEVHRQKVYTSARVLNDIVRHFTGEIHAAVRQMESVLERIQKYEFWRWIVILAFMSLLGFVMLLIVMGLLCGCGQARDHGKRTLQVSAFWSAFVSIMLWAFISAIFLVAGHAEIYVCQALWDAPQYKTLAALLNRPSPLLQDNEGIFDALFRDFENVTVDVSVSEVLRECENDKPAYVVFQLDKILDVNKATSYFEWTELQSDLRRLTSSIDVGYLKTVTAYFNRLLGEILNVSDINLAQYRMNYNRPIVGKDLPSLVDQLENVAAQVTDLTTAGRLETLATRTQRLHVSNIRPLEQMRAEIVYKLTELELQLMPYRRKLNISLSHIHTAQYYINNQGDVIAHKKASMFVSRLLSHAAGWRSHALTSTSKLAARCRPLYNVYAAVRSLICINYVSSLHGWWICGFLLGVSWCTALLPLLVKLWRVYGKRIRASETMTLANLGQQETPTTALCESSNWNTPGPPPPRNDSW